MKTQFTLRPEPVAMDVAPLQSDRRFRLDPDVVAMVASTYAAADAAQKRHGVANLLMQAIGMLQVWRDRARSRHDLASCDARMLRDLGISPYDAGREAGKPFWRA
jgi:uncharacterized protein YjiS (DUF1127 family)